MNAPCDLYTETHAALPLPLLTAITTWLDAREIDALFLDVWQLAGIVLFLGCKRMLICSIRAYIMEYREETYDLKRLGKIAIPTLIIWGGLDSLIPIG